MNYWKAIAAVAAAGFGAVAAALTGDGAVDATEGINIVIMVLGAAAVLVAPNVPGSRYTKLAHAALTAVAVAAASLVADGLSWTDAAQLVVAALGALGVYLAPYRVPVSVAAYFDAPRAVSPRASTGTPFPPNPTNLEGT